ncbi:hypothetical protein NPIL_201331 [Nephila pilipes]|uniref:Uncharacterized protein n=1 Tax=Nephila pilipes TaxID=299642 RepID=A0A8X6UNH9_NEPPI|nr:hypothetical protein NPIL_201331 [Nephila pilipes]
MPSTHSSSTVACPDPSSPPQFKLNSSDNQGLSASDNHRVITSFLKEEKVDYCVTQPTSQKPLKVILKGLPFSTEIKNIQTEIENLGFQIGKTKMPKCGKEHFTRESIIKGKVENPTSALTTKVPDLGRTSETSKAERKSSQPLKQTIGIDLSPPKKSMN